MGVAAIKTGSGVPEASIAPAAIICVTTAGSLPTPSAAAGSPTALLALAQLLGRQAAREALHQRRGCSMIEIVWVLLAVAAGLAVAIEPASLTVISGWF